MIRFLKKNKYFLQLLNNKRYRKNAFERALDKTFICLMIVFGSIDVLIMLICIMFDS